jgi:hypothetical protein
VSVTDGLTKFSSRCIRPGVKDENVNWWCTVMLDLSGISASSHILFV